MAKIMMSLELENKLFGTEKMESIFTNIKEPITGDELTSFFFRFALACGYGEIGMANSLVCVGNDFIPPERLQIRDADDM